MEPEPALQARRGKFAPNLIGNVLSFAVSMVVGFWYTAYLMRHLGPAAFGIIPLATTITSYMAVLTMALNSSVGRSLTVALAGGEEQEASRIFNTSFFGSLALAGALLVPLLLLAYLAPHVVNVPAGQELESRLLFLAAGLGFLLNTVITPFGVATFCTNRLDLSSLLAIVQTLVRTGLVVVLFSLLPPQLWQVGAGLLFAGVVGSAGYVLVFRKLLPRLRLNFRDFSRAMLSKLTDTGLWVSVTQLGTIFTLGIDLFLVNRLLGPLVAGRYAVPLQLSMLLRTITGTLASLFAPTIMSLYGQGDLLALVAYTRRSVRCVGFFVALAAGLLCGFSEALLRLWLGPDFVSLAPLLCLMIAPLCVNLAVLPMFALNLAVNRVRQPALVTLAMGVLNIGLALVLAGPVGWGMYGVAAASVILLTAKNVGYIPWFTASSLGLPAATFLGGMFEVLLAAIGLGLVAWHTAHVLPINTWLMFFLTGGLVAAGFGAAVYAFLLKPDEKREVQSRLEPALAKLRIALRRVAP